MTAVDDLALYREQCVGDLAEEPYLAAIFELETENLKLKNQLREKFDLAASTPVTARITTLEKQLADVVEGHNDMFNKWEYASGEAVRAEAELAGLRAQRDEAMDLLRQSNFWYAAQEMRSRWAERGSG